MRRRTWAVMLGLAIAALPAIADEPQFADGRYLLEQCTSKDNAEIGYCLGYVAGAGTYNDQGTRRNCPDLGAPQESGF